MALHGLRSAGYRGRPPGPGARGRLRPSPQPPERLHVPQSALVRRAAFLTAFLAIALEIVRSRANEKRVALPRAKLLLLARSERATDGPTADVAVGTFEVDGAIEV